MIDSVSEHQVSKGNKGEGYSSPGQRGVVVIVVIGPGVVSLLVVWDGRLDQPTWGIEVYTRAAHLTRHPVSTPYHMSTLWLVVMTRSLQNFNQSLYVSHLVTMVTWDLSGIMGYMLAGQLSYIIGIMDYMLAGQLSYIIGIMGYMLAGQLSYIIGIMDYMLAGQLSYIIGIMDYMLAGQLSYIIGIGRNW